MGQRLSESGGGALASCRRGPADACLLADDGVVGKAALGQVDGIARSVLGEVGGVLAAALGDGDAGGIAGHVGRQPEVVALLIDLQLAVVAQVIGSDAIGVAIGRQIQLITLAGDGGRGAIAVTCLRQGQLAAHAIDIHVRAVEIAALGDVDGTGPRVAAGVPDAGIVAVALLHHLGIHPLAALLEADIVVIAALLDDRGRVLTGLAHPGLVAQAEAGHLQVLAVTVLSQVQLAVESILADRQGVLARRVAVLLDVDLMIAAVLMDRGVLPQAALAHHRRVAAARSLIDLHPVIAAIALLDIHQALRSPDLIDLDRAPGIGLHHPHAVICIVLLGDLGIEKAAALLDIRLVARRQLAALVQVHHIEAAVLLDVGRIGRGPGGTGVG